jgi:hypothetical protein
MPSWDEVREHAREKYNLQEETDRSFKLVWEYRNGRFQMITVSRFEAIDREWVDFVSAACKREQLEPEEALKRNYTFAQGALCLDGDVYVVRYSTLLATMDMDEFELPLHIVAQTADQLEAELTNADDF